MARQVRSAAFSPVFHDPGKLSVTTTENPRDHGGTAGGVWHAWSETAATVAPSMILKDSPEELWKILQDHGISAAVGQRNPSVRRRGTNSAGVSGGCSGGGGLRRRRFRRRGRLPRPPRAARPGWLCGRNGSRAPASCWPSPLRGVLRRG